MPDFGAIAGLLGNVKSIFDFVAGTTGSLAGFVSTDAAKNPVTLIETLFSGSTSAEV
ncbi:hypothetical protein SAMN06265174_103128 [Dietzia kunjamensis subsp. schimae]|uniref:Uncharacterized protein n=1 Tax=Dietzia kunjamensis subsp. schimae TaxID=498198 RepID=A0ABY1N091_9ACTN|nr:hypothetical protein [Dietzia kunjamensis]MBB1015429.1 hypothetical protein [Dietzia kunjamensis subsp. schimae]SMO65161.1 hypothetical protein SAMN06265174_103128 [Dietzia kunjamensis subsp. schimae]